VVKTTYLSTTHRATDRRTPGLPDCFNAYRRRYNY